MFLSYAAWFATMGGLLLLSAFFSASEAALFSLPHALRRQMAAGSRAQRLAAGLLDDPSRLLTTVLFWNLMVNLLYFTLGSIVSLDLQRDGYPAAAGVFAVGSFVLLVLLGEMLPKAVAILQAQRLAPGLALLLAPVVRLIGPLVPVFRITTLLSRRLLWPTFQPEPYLQVRDLERAVRLSATDTALVEQEEQVLESIVQLSEIQAEELMRPRTQFLSFRPPVRLEDLQGRVPPGGYLLVTEPDSDEVAAAIDLDDLWQAPADALDTLAQPVVYVPWSTRVADVLELIRARNRQVAAVVNEYGETVGILTFDDILDTIFSGTPSRSERLLRRSPIRQMGPGVWRVTGITSVRRLARHFQIERPETTSVTVAGVLQEVLERLPQPGDECRWGPFHFKVLDVPRRGQVVVELRLAEPEEDQP